MLDYSFPQTPCPYLFLAPMENLGDRTFRKAIARIGGFDEAVTEFISVPAKAHVASLVREYQVHELSPIPLTPQIMGADPYLMAATAHELEKKGALRVDINCGCPSNTVTGRGAGSSLLKTPSFLYSLAKEVVQAVNIPVTLKMRSGYEDISLFEENLKAAEESGVRFITLHPRTKVDGYSPPARWDLIARAKELLRIPVIGNGDVTSLEALIRLRTETKCDGIMIGRGAVRDPFLFQKIRSHFLHTPFTPSFALLQEYLQTFIQEKSKVSKLKQVLSFLFTLHPHLIQERQSMLRMQPETPLSFLDNVLPLLERRFTEIFSSPDTILL
ncbi:MAG: tRNA-dihydrouridine synthase family protein [Chlamydiae bacterium]|nr:tRNA-dihydrouridine synthase family protein [Chlamydiota bacterium]